MFSEYNNNNEFIYNSILNTSIEIENNNYYNTESVENNIIPEFRNAYQDSNIKYNFLNFSDNYSKYNTNSVLDINPQFNLNLIDDFYSDEYKNEARIKQFIGKIKFYYNNHRINWYKLEYRNNKILYYMNTINDYFKNDDNPEIYDEVGNNFLKSINVKYKTIQGNIFKKVIGNMRTLDHLLTKYLY